MESMKFSDIRKFSLFLTQKN